MAEAENKQRKLVRRPAEERIAEIDKKIAGHKDAIQNQRQRKMQSLIQSHVLLKPLA